MTKPAEESSRARALRVAGRLDEYRGEEKANLLRVVGISLAVVVIAFLVCMPMMTAGRYS